MITVNVTVNKIYPKYGKKANGEGYTMNTFYGKAENGTDFKASAFSPLCDDVKEGKIYTFETETSGGGKYTNIIRVSEENGTLEETPPDTKSSVPTTPLPAQGKPYEKKEPAGKQASIEKMHEDKQSSIEKQVALKEATKDMGNISMLGMSDQINTMAVYENQKDLFFISNCRRLKGGK